MVTCWCQGFNLSGCTTIYLLGQIFRELFLVSLWTVLCMHVSGLRKERLVSEVLFGPFSFCYNIMGHSSPVLFVKKKRCTRLNKKSSKQVKWYYTYYRSSSISSNRKDHIFKQIQNTLSEFMSIVI
jgi:hypothetical protein